MQKINRKPRTSTSDSGEPGLSQELASKLSPTIVSLASFDEGALHSQRTGIVIRNRQSGASILTSSDLGWFNPLLRIRVRLPNGELINGFVQHYSLPCRMFVVTADHSPDLRVACFGEGVQVEPLGAELLAVRRCYHSGELMGRSGELVGSPDGVESEGFMLSTCGITATGGGGPLVDLDGNIVGMNCYDDGELTPFVPTNRILECLHDLGFFRSYTRKEPTPSNLCSEGSLSLGSENEKQEPCVPVVWCELDQELASKLSSSIVSVASFDGETLQSECTGIVTDSRLSSPAFLTSPSLYRSIGDKHVLAMQIKVRLPNDEVVEACLQDIMPSDNLLLVTTDPLPPFPDLHLARLSNSMRVESAAEVLAVRRCFKSGKLMATSGVLIDSPSGVKLSTCKITEDASGGPLVDLDGNIVGMNYYARKKSPYVPSNFISECFGPDVFWSGSNEDGCSTSERSSDEIQTSSKPYHWPEEVTDHVQPSPIIDPAELTDNGLKRILDPWPSDDNDVFTTEVNKILNDLGYPLPCVADGGMYLKGDFEEKFGKDICSKSVERVASKMSRYVVALASFDDEGRRYFACAGMLVGCNKSTTRVLTSASLVRTSGGENKIHKLRIEVCLPSKEYVAGTLEHYDLHYNVAVVSFSGDCSNGAAKLSETFQTKVVALGRGFRSGELMVTNGVVTGERSRFDCEELQMSTCKITKSGIGGPLVDFDGNFVGLNFYDVENTPFLPRDIILEFLSSFSSEPIVAAEVAKKSSFNRWPVPEPYWVYPTRLHHLQARHLLQEEDD
ncbi:unnamed protein product [Alopecurus aequalis]